jgi:hypothetical protein
MPNRKKVAPLSNASLPARRNSHGIHDLPLVTIDSYSLELRDDERAGFVGDRASRTAFTGILHAWRRQMKRVMGGADPLGDVKTHELGSRTDDLLQGDTPAAHTVQAAVEDYAHQLAHVTHRFMSHKAWQGVERIIVGGGFQQSETGKLAIARAAQLLRSQSQPVDLRLLHYHPDEGGLVGWAHIVPARELRGMTAFLAVDIGGTNARCGIVRPNYDEAHDLRNAEVVMRAKWGHAADEDVTRRANVVGGIVGMLEKLIDSANRTGIELAPFVGVACPGVVRGNGTIANGTQNLPGDWEAPNFNLPAAMREKLPKIQGQQIRVLLHNDAVVQGLSQRPFTSDVKRWGVLTLGTGLGNASFTNK